ncbi:hypothetical protein, partial [Methyloversatilis sp.]|uniref:hypothetical protein n=1 Tax=Methyloversatilis sp. TaxID=2569862 RepID=UPI00352428FA
SSPISGMRSGVAVRNATRPASLRTSGISTVSGSSRPSRARLPAWLSLAADADQWQRQRSRSRGIGLHHCVGRTAQALAVDASRPAQRGDEAADPAAKRWLELPRINHLEYAQKGVLRRRAGWQREKAAQPGSLLCHPFGDVFDRVAVGHVK